MWRSEYICIYAPASNDSARAREAKIDRRGPRIGPAGGDDLATRVERDALRPIHVQVAEQRRLPAAEAVVGDGHRNRHVDADHTDVDVELVLPHRPTIAGEDRGAVPVWVVVDDLQRLGIVVRA